MYTGARPDADDADVQALPPVDVRDVRLALDPVARPDEAEVYAELHRALCAHKAPSKTTDAEDEPPLGAPAKPRPGRAPDDGTDSEVEERPDGEEREDGDDGAVDHLGGSLSHVDDCRMSTVHPVVALRALAARKGQSHDAVLRYLERADAALRDGHAAASAKIGFVVRDLAQAPAKACVVFYIWNEERRLLESALVEAGVSTRCFHGGMSFAEREGAVAQFHDPDVTPAPAALLAQIKCASHGLNLQARATHVYLMSPHWNPMVERQAIARVHRTGQTRAVSVARLVLEGTVDEQLLRRQARKLRCAEQVARACDAHVQAPCH
jgi:hypothetical protein